MGGNVCFSFVNSFFTLQAVLKGENWGSIARRNQCCFSAPAGVLRAPLVQPSIAISIPQRASPRLDAAPDPKVRGAGAVTPPFALEAIQGDPSNVLLLCDEGAARSVHCHPGNRFAMSGEQGRLPRSRSTLPAS
jgi:hypothetical protein